MEKNRQSQEKKPVKLAVVILYAVCAVIWLVNCAAHLIYDTSEGLVIMNGICAIAWITAFVVQLTRYRDGKKETAAEESKPEE